MGKTVTIEVLGVDKIVKDIQTVAQARRFKQTMGKCAAIVEGTAKSLCPKDTGRLVGSIHPSVIDTGDEITGKVSTNVDYAVYVEFGTGIRGSLSAPEHDAKDIANWGFDYKTDWAGQIAQPFLFPALKQNEQKIHKMLEDALRNEI